MVSSVSSSTISSWASSLFSKLDTKKQGYIEKSDLESAFSSIAQSTGTTDDTDVDALFGQLDTDSDGKVTESELTTAMSQVADQLDTQYYQTRMQGAMSPPPQSGSGGRSDSTSSTSSSTDSTYIEAADTNGDGEVSIAELAAYYASQSESTSSSDSNLTSLMAAMGSMPPPPPPDTQSANSAGFTKDELTSQLEQIGSTDSKRSELISSIVQNFDKADTDGDGKVSMHEARAYDQNTTSGSTSTASADSTYASTQVEQTILKLMQAYGIGQDASASNTSTLLSAIA